jgi:hypothetical protein
MKGFEMKRFSIALVLLVAGVAGVGLYRGWFQVTSEAATDQHKVTFSADSTKIKEDEKTVVQKVKNLGNQVEDKVDTPTETSKAETVQPTQGPQHRE